MGDRPGSSSRVRTSEDKVRRKDLCWSVRAVYILEKLLDVSGPGLGEAGRYRIVSEHGLACYCSQVYLKQKAFGKRDFKTIKCASDHILYA